MFIEKEDLLTAVTSYNLDGITTARADIDWAVRAAVSEARSYVGVRYDCDEVFSARGNDRHPALLEYCKCLAIWYLVRRCNTNLIYSQVKEYRDSAVDWLEKIAGISTSGVVLEPDLPPKA